jgi:TRAP-type mannitol/chloroaromatic compound transport system permease small subunit
VPNVVEISQNILIILFDSPNCLLSEIYSWPVLLLVLFSILEMNNNPGGAKFTAGSVYDINKGRHLAYHGFLALG